MTFEKEKERLPKTQEGAMNEGQKGKEQRKTEGATGTGWQNTEMRKVLLMRKEQDSRFSRRRLGNLEGTPEQGRVR